LLSAGSIWRETTSAHAGPPERQGAAIGVLNGTVVLFGGLVPGPSVLSETWTWDGMSWKLVSVGGPPPRFSAVMASLQNRLVLFGGSSIGADLGDTWAWDGAQWTELQVPGPSARAGATMASMGGDLVLFGGGSFGPEGVNFRDTWTFNGSSWRQVAVSGPTPTPRGGATMTTLGNEVVLFGGSASNNETQSLLGDTWTFDGTSWAQLEITGPSPRAGAAMTTP